MPLAHSEAIAQRVCKRCVMDTSDPDIHFDDAGVCHHCALYDAMIMRSVPPHGHARALLEQQVDAWKRRGRGGEFDCIIGVSGGVDSSSVAALTRELGLRVLAVHLDNGWDSELAVQNIERVVTKLNIQLHTVVLDWDEFRDLQLSFLRASTPDVEIPTDHAIVSTLFNVARERGVPVILSGGNARTESHLPPAWSQGHEDWRYIRSVQRLFGTRRLRTFPHRGKVRQRLDSRGIAWVDVLNWVDYSKAGAVARLERELGWRPYQSKHFESVYTRFTQGCWLPNKFGFDKRRSHLSSLVCSGEISRADALDELARAPYPLREQEADSRYVAKKLGLAEDELQALMRAPPRRFEDYPSYQNSIPLTLYRSLRDRFAHPRGTHRPDMIRP